MVQPYENFKELEENAMGEIAQMLHEEMEIYQGIIQTADITFNKGMRISPTLQEENEEEEEGFYEVRSTRMTDDEEIGKGGSSASAPELPRASDGTRSETVLMTDVGEEDEIESQQTEIESSMEDDEQTEYATERSESGKAQLAEAGRVVNK